MPMGDIQKQLRCKSATFEKVVKSKVTAITILIANTFPCHHQSTVGLYSLLPWYALMS